MERREFCRAAAVGAVGLATAGTASATETTAETASATETTGDVPGYVSTRGHYDIAFSEEYLVDGYDETDYDVEGTIPGYEGDAPDELLVMVHGYGQGESDAETIVETASAGFDAAGFDGPVVGFTWDSDFPQTEWWDTVEIASENGLKLAQFCYDYGQRAPDATLRVVGHSLGAEVVLNAIEALDEADATDAVDTATLLGAAVDDEAASLWAGPFEDEYGSEIGRAVGQFDNYHKTDDETLTNQYEFAEWDAALGSSGVEGDAPANYADHDVSYVAGHETYFEFEDGCTGAVVDAW